MRPTDQLNAVGLKATTPRLKVLQVFHGGSSRHLSAEDVHRQISEQRLDVGLATVYRILNQLTDVGILARNLFDSGKAVYELHNGEPHDHLICLDCGCVEEFSDNVIDARQRSVAAAKGYTLAERQLVLYGYCPRCQSKPAS